MADKYEYKVVVSDDDDETDETSLNELGTEGWELVSAIADVRADEESEAEDENIPVTVFYLKKKVD
jgi:hypothetical protein